MVDVNTDLGFRIEASGLTKAEFAEKLSVTRQVVNNWISRGSWSEEAEELLVDLEKPREMIGVGDLVRIPEGYARVIRRDRCETLFGDIKVQWVYHVQACHEVKDGWAVTGPALRFPRKFLKSLTEITKEPVWLTKEQMKAARDGN